jgi:uncharacterized protein YjbI with pentapeptide repeats
MTDNYIEDQSFEGIDFSVKGIETGEYENCIFTNCDLSGSDLSGISFMECEFSNCNLSNINLNNTALKDVKFVHCKMLGLIFSDCEEFLFSVEFIDCQLDLSSFYKVMLKTRLFANCSLHDVDFAEADLTGAVFRNCDLEGAIFEHTNLERASFQTSYNFTIDPEENNIRKAKFSVSGLIGLLGKYSIDVE